MKTTDAVYYYLRTRDELCGFVAGAVVLPRFNLIMFTKLNHQREIQIMDSDIFECM